MGSYVCYSFKIKNLYVVTATEITGRLSSRANARVVWAFLALRVKV